MAAISQNVFSNAFLYMKSFVFWLQFHWSLFLGDKNPYWQESGIALDNGLAPNTWIKADPIHWRICTVLVGDELNVTGMITHMV